MHAVKEEGFTHTDMSQSQYASPKGESGWNSQRKDGKIRLEPGKKVDDVVLLCASIFSAHLNSS